MLVAAGAVGMVACVGELTPVDPATGGPGGGPDAGRGGGATEARDYFDTEVQPLLALPRPKGACTVCHQGVDPGNGPDFLGADAAANYDALTANPRLVSGDPATSLLVTKGEHAGDAFAPAEISIINEWILMEAGR
ncbi:MAG: hypothetical protein D6689_12585 [Deltaproteobacteria bacterium]|nr:MAG: hypothetical protein D6689_12585 [Deltaproteobacteria bacterium]